MFRASDGYPLIISSSGTKYSCEDYFRDVFDTSPEDFELVARAISKESHNITVVRSGYNTLFIFRPTSIPVFYVAEVHDTVCSFYALVCEMISRGENQFVMTESAGLFDRIKENPPVMAGAIIDDIIRLFDALREICDADARKLCKIGKDLSLYFCVDINIRECVGERKTLSNHYTFDAGMFSAALSFIMLAVDSGNVDIGFGYTDKLLYVDMDLGIRRGGDEAFDQFLSVFNSLGVPIMCSYDKEIMRVRVCPYVRTRLFDGSIKSDFDFIDFGDFGNENKES